MGCRPILCLYRPEEEKRLSAMISGCDWLKVENYKNLDQGKKIIDDFYGNIEQIRKDLENRLTERFEEN